MFSTERQFFFTFLQFQIKEAIYHVQYKHIWAKFVANDNDLDNANII